MLTKRAKLILVRLCFSLLTAQIVFAGGKTTAPEVHTRTILLEDARSLGQGASDHVFLEDLERRAFRYFQEQTHPQTGLVLDRARTDAALPDEGHRNTASIAVTGFGLTGWCIAAERGWVSLKEARAMVRTTLRFFADQAQHDHGWF